MNIRCFVALNFSVAATRRIAEDVERRKAQVAAAGAKVAWVPAANLHVTLAFLGTIDEDVVEAIAGRLGRVARSFAPLQGRARGLGGFPSLERPNILWIGAEADGLAKLQRDVAGQLAELGFDPETRPFHAHVTVGRVKH